MSQCGSPRKIAVSPSSDSRVDSDQQSEAFVSQYGSPRRSAVSPSSDGGVELGEDDSSDGGVEREVGQKGRRRVGVKERLGSRTIVG